MFYNVMDERRYLMVRKLTKNGDSYSLEIDRLMLERLGIDENTPLEVRMSGRAITFEPAEDATQRSADLDRFIEDTNERYGEVLKRLAE